MSIFLQPADVSTIEELKGFLVNIVDMDGDEWTGLLGFRTAPQDRDVIALLDDTGSTILELLIKEVKMIKGLDQSQIGKIVRYNSSNVLFTQFLIDTFEQTYNSLRSTSLCNLDISRITVSNSSSYGYSSSCTSSCSSSSNCSSKPVSNYNTTCPKCGAPAYMGLFSITCSKGC